MSCFYDPNQQYSEFSQVDYRNKKVTYYLSPDQQAILASMVNEIYQKILHGDTSANYAEAYAYLRSTLPPLNNPLSPEQLKTTTPYQNVPKELQQDREILALHAWLLVVQSTNGRAAEKFYLDIRDPLGNKARAATAAIDLGLRGITQAIMYGKNSNKPYSDERYNQYSNDMARNLLTIIAKTGIVSNEGIIQADAQSFTRFDPNTIRPQDWPGAAFDWIALGGDWIGKDMSDWEELGVFKDNLHNALKRLVYEETGWGYVPCNTKGYQNLSRSGQFHTYDPLALDLDGDGLETVGTRRLSGSLFDHDADGIRTASGWVSADDGFLVYDRNGNGLIDSGRELFGDHTLLADGSRAAHGYAALAELDSDSNGRVDAADKDFSSLRVWRDLNQDGISQGGELFSLADVGVQVLNLAHTTPNTDLGNGNFLAQSGSYTKTDGSSAQMGDLDLASDHLFSRFTDSVKLTAEQLQAPNLQGMGRLRDLREAAALSGSLTKIPNAGKRAVNDGTWGFQVA